MYYTETRYTLIWSLLIRYK